jgi:hypothetical protein
MGYTLINFIRDGIRLIFYSIIVFGYEDTATTASAPSLSDRFMNNITTDTLTLLHVCGIVFMVAVVAYLVSNYSAITTKRLAVTEPRQ